MRFMFHTFSDLIFSFGLCLHQKSCAASQVLPKVTGLFYLFVYSCLAIAACSYIDIYILRECLVPPRWFESIAQDGLWCNVTRGKPFITALNSLLTTQGWKVACANVSAEKDGELAVVLYVEWLTNAVHWLPLHRGDCTFTNHVSSLALTHIWWCFSAEAQSKIYEHASRISGRKQDHDEVGIHSSLAKQKIFSPLCSISDIVVQALDQTPLLKLLVAFPAKVESDHSSPVKRNPGSDTVPKNRSADKNTSGNGIDCHCFIKPCTCEDGFSV